MDEKVRIDGVPDFVVQFISMRSHHCIRISLNRVVSVPFIRYNLPVISCTWLLIFNWE